MNANLPEKRKASSSKRLTHFEAAENNPQTTLPTYTKPYKNSDKFTWHSTKLDVPNVPQSLDGVYNNPYPPPNSIAVAATTPAAGGLGDQRDGLAHLSNSNNSNSSSLPPAPCDPGLLQKSDPPPLIQPARAEPSQHLSLDNTKRLQHVDDQTFQVPKPPHLIHDVFQSANTLAYLKMEPGPSEAPVLLDMPPPGDQHQHLYQAEKSFVAFVQNPLDTPLHPGPSSGPWMSSHMGPPHNHLTAGILF